MNHYDRLVEEQLRFGRATQRLFIRCKFAKEAGTRCKCSACVAFRFALKQANIDEPLQPSNPVLQLRMGLLATTALDLHVLSLAELKCGCTACGAWRRRSAEMNRAQLAVHPAG